MQVQQLIVAAAWLASTPEGADDPLPKHTLAVALSKLLLFGQHHCVGPGELLKWWRAEFGPSGDARWQHAESFLHDIAQGREAHALADQIQVSLF